MIEPSTHALPTGGVPLADDVRRLLTRAYTEAQQLGHWYVAAEHVVLALAADARDTALLGRLGVDRDRVREEVTATALRGAGGGPPEEWPQPVNVFTERTRLAFALAAQSAREFGHTSVRVEHLLLGLLRERGSAGAQALTRCGLSEPRALAAARTSGGAASAPSP
jgi:ATP-dependent Clp protease ATP-binding subunit ClpC